MSKASATPSKSLLTPRDHILIMIDFQSQMAFPTRSIDITVLRNNAALIAKSAKIFGVATIPTTVAEKSFSGPVFPEILEVFKGLKFIDRTTMNSWEDQNVINEVKKLDRSRIVLSGLWTSVCIAGPALSALEQGFEVYVITDACGDISTEAHDMAISRMIQAGARPLTSLTYMLELQRDWARGETYNAVMGIATEHGGGYGIGIQYAKTMFGGKEGH